MRTAFIGGGVMAEAMISRAIAQGIAEPGQLTVAEPVASRRQELAKQYAVKVTPENTAALDDAGLVVLSVKPQHLGEVLAGLQGRLAQDQTALSIVAGATIATLTMGLGHQRHRVVRDGLLARPLQGADSADRRQGVQRQHRSRQWTGRARSAGSCATSTTAS